jgi:hypothetical protein
MVLENHENEFMAVYKGQMMKVKIKLKFPRNKSVEGAGMLSNYNNITYFKHKLNGFSSKLLFLTPFFKNRSDKFRNIRQIGSMF